MTICSKNLGRPWALSPHPGYAYVWYIHHIHYFWAGRNFTYQPISDRLFDWR